MEKLRERCVAIATKLESEIGRVLEQKPKGDSQEASLTVKFATTFKPPQTFIEQLSSSSSSTDSGVTLTTPTSVFKPVQQAGAVNCWEKLLSSPENPVSLLKDLSFNKGKSVEILREKQNQKWAENCYNEGQLHLRKGKKLEAALKCFENAVELNPALTDARMSVALICSRLGKTDRAVNCYKQILKDNPENIEAMVKLRQNNVRGLRVYDSWFFIPSSNRLRGSLKLQLGIPYVRPKRKRSPEKAEVVEVDTPQEQEYKERKKKRSKSKDSRKKKKSKSKHKKHKKKKKSRD